MQINTIFSISLMSNAFIQTEADPELILNCFSSLCHFDLFVWLLLDKNYSLLFDLFNFHCTRSGCITYIFSTIWSTFCIFFTCNSTHNYADWNSVKIKIYILLTDCYET
ncbi:phosphatidylinositol-glycan biosynthesis class F protein [Aphis craccivora]|uniref:Phosphatidylinositol-glycan biosynthesis class F protein n=1 Tax=Aphis craccivora TaxID=307492 RepID=A0A6G0Y3S3_APHCR|nr:phosphatidylinositol-glycan biosynthesis class F protein [Aphis craccivora]